MDDLVYRAVNRLFLAVFWLLDLRFDIRGAEHLPTSGPAVVACNHVSYLDFTFIELAARGRGRFVRFLAKRSVFDVPVVGALMRAMRHVPVDRFAGAAAYRGAGGLLRRGELVGIFPEATISRSWMLKHFKAGAAALSIQGGVAIVPVIVWGGHRVITVDRHWSLRRGKAITIVVGAPYRPSSRVVDAAVAELRDKMAALLAEAQRTYPDRPAGPHDLWWVPATLGGTAPVPDEAARRDSAALTRARSRLDVLAARRDRPG
jgi:1-acyl-sn-glycerol-3-phosphate acyltransferase